MNSKVSKSVYQLRFYGKAVPLISMKFWPEDTSILKATLQRDNRHKCRRPKTSLNMNH